MSNTTNKNPAGRDAARIEALKKALDDEVHGLWISDDMAVKVLAAVDAAAARYPLPVDVT
jgi:hypothetical protein